MLKFYFNGAPNPNKVALFLEETGLPCERPVSTIRRVSLDGRGAGTLTAAQGDAGEAEAEEAQRDRLRNCIG